MTVQHIHVVEGGQAIVGNVSTPAPDPMLLDMQRARCHAKSKRSGLQCQVPAVRGHNVCRMHGAAGGATKGKYERPDAR